MIYSTINSSVKYPVTEEMIANLLREGKLPDEYFAHICSFFTDIPINTIVKFISYYNIKIETLKEYYEKYIKKYYQNKDIEELI